MGPRHLRRPADRPGPDRRGRGPRHRPPAAARPRVLAARSCSTSTWSSSTSTAPPTPQDLHDALETARPDEPVDASATTARPAHGGVYIAARRPVVAPRTGRSSSRPPGRVLLSRRGSLADQVIRLERPSRRAPPAAAPPEPAAPRARRRPRRARSSSSSTGSAASPTDGREYVDDPRPGPVDAGALAQRDRQPGVRVPGLRVRLGLHLVGQQPREPAHAVVATTRSPTRSSEAIYVRDDESGELWGPTALPIRVRGVDVRRPPRRRATAGSSTPTTASSSNLVQFVPLDEPVKVSRADDRQPVRARPAPVGHGLRRMGAGHVARRERAARSSPSSTRRPGRSLARNPWNTEFAGRVAFLDLGGRQTAWTADRTEFLGRNGAPGPAGRRWTAATSCSGAVGAGLDPCAALQTSFELADGARTRGRSSCSARPTRRARCAELVRRGRAPDHDGDAARAVATQLGRHPGHGPGADARPVDGHHAQPLAALPDARLPALGADRASTRPAAPTASATSSRTSSPWSRRGATSPASTSCAPPPASSSRATCSTGGIRRPAGASGPGSPTTGCGCRTSSTATSRSPATRRSSTRRSRTSRAPALRPDQDDAYCQPERLGRDRRRCYEHCAARDRPEPRRSARTACR